MNWKKKLSEVKKDGVLAFYIQTNSFKNERIAIIDRNVNFVEELASRAHFKDTFILIKNYIGTIPLILLRSYLLCHLCSPLVREKYEILEVYFLFNS